MIRKIIGILFSVILVSCLAIPVYAEYPMWHYVKDLEALVPLPSGMEYLTRDTEKNNPLLGKLGQTLDNVLADFNKNYVYFQLWKSDLSYMFNISMTASGFIDMNDFKQTDWGEFIESVIDKFDYADVSEIAIYRTSASTYASFSAYTYNGSYYVTSYYYVTIYHGKEIVFQLYSKDGAPTEGQRVVFRDFMDEVYYGAKGEIFQKPSVETANPGFIYTDINLGS